MRRRSRAAIWVLVTLGQAAWASTSSAQWIMGGTQRASNYFTLVETTFRVPPAPTQMSSAVTNIWPGLEDANGTWVLQPVLSYGFLQEAWLMDDQVVGPSNGNPNNTSCSTGNARYCDNPQRVYPNDSITAGVIIDAFNPGPNCNLSTGANCNYDVGWTDNTTGAHGSLSDWVTPVPLNWAQGLIFEANFYTGLDLPPPTSCAAYPGPYVDFGQVVLYETTGQDTVNLVYGANSPYPWSPLQNPSGCQFSASFSSNVIGLFFWN